MKTYSKLALLAGVLMLGACKSSENINGEDVPCAGFGRDRTPGYEYDLSVRNVVFGALGSGLFFIPPAVVAYKEYECPIGVLPKVKTP